MKKLTIIAILLTTFSALNAQTVEIDSLENVLQLHIKKDTVRVNLLNKIASITVSSNTEKALQYAQEAEKLSEKLSFKKGKAESLLQMGEYYYYISNYEKAISYYQKSLQINNKLGDKQKASKCLNNIGFAHKKAGNYKQAIEYYQKALKIDEDIQNKRGASNNLNSIGILYSDQGNYLKALEYYQKSLKIEEDVENKRGVSTRVNNIGTIYLLTKNYPKALEYYQKSLKLKEELKDSLGISSSINNIGIVHLYSGDYPKALEYFQKSLHIEIKLGSNQQIANAYNNIGEVYQFTGKYQKSLEYYQKSCEIAVEICSDLVICITNFNMGAVYLKTNNYTKALIYTNNSLKKAKELELIDNQRDAYKQLSEIYSALKEYKRAYNNQLLYIEFKDSVLNEKNIKKITSLELNYEFEKEKQAIEFEQQKKDVLTAKKIKYQKTIKTVFIIGLFVAIFIIILFYRIVRIKKKNNNVLRKKNHEISEKKDLIFEQKTELEVQTEDLNRHKENLEEIVEQRTFALQKAKEQTEKSEEELKEKYDQLNLIMESANIGWWDWDIPSGNEVYNDILPELLGYKTDEIKPHISWWKNKIHHLDLKQVEIDLQEHFEKKADFYINEHRLKTKSNEWKWFLNYGKVIERDKNRQPVRMIGTLRVIDEQKNAEKELRKAKIRAEESDRLKTEFIHNMSHEIRTPLNGILGFSGFLNNPELKEETKKHYVNIIQRSGNQLLKIINDILEISKLATKQVKVAEKKICLNNFLSELFFSFGIKAKEEKIALYLKKGLSDKESNILTDEELLNKILINLLTNALKFTKEGFIEFGYQLKNSELEFYVKDTGIGIKPESQEIIFKRFSQEEKEIYKNVGGLGLGLSLAKENAELLGGKITLKSEKGKATTFFITIPYKPADTETIINISNNDKEKITNKQDKYKILIVEDEEINYFYLHTLLKNRTELNCNILHAKDGKEAVEMCKENTEIDLVLMDMKMPIMSGYEATKLIKKIRPDLPIVAQTAYSTRDEKEQAFSVGCDDFISKPISEKVLNRTINKYLIMR